jgi:hypothetical protein
MRFTKIILFYIIIGFIGSCKNEPLLMPANQQYSKTEIDSIKYSVIRYLGKLAGKANNGTKFNTEFDEYYKNLANSHDLVYFIKNQNDDYYYFLFTRIAPSLYEKKVAIGGKLMVENGKLTHYEEAFRTWKMLVPELEQKMNIIFQDYLDGKDLSQYYTKNSNNVEYIEFPDDQNSFDIEKRMWVSSIDYMEPYYQLKRGVDTVASK